MIREFVKAFKKMGELTNNMKAYMTKEIEVLNVLVGAKDKEIQKFSDENAEYKSCLRIPRQHFKFIEKLRLEELMSQRDEILKKMARKFGVDE